MRAPAAPGEGRLLPAAVEPLRGATRREGQPASVAAHRVPRLSVDNIIPIVSPGPPRPRGYSLGVCSWHSADKPPLTWVDPGRAGMRGQVGVLNDRAGTLIIRHRASRRPRRPWPPAPPRRSRRGVSAVRFLPRNPVRVHEVSPFLGWLHPNPSGVPFQREYFRRRTCPPSNWP